IQTYLFSTTKIGLERRRKAHPYALFLINRLRYNLPMAQHVVFFLDGSRTPYSIVRPRLLREPPTLGGRAGEAARAAWGGHSIRERGQRWRRSTQGLRRWKEARP